MKALLIVCALSCGALSLSSCVGVDAVASIGKDGSGKLQLRYKVSKMLVSLGSLEANERLIPFPVSREDFERTSRGITGLSLVSYSQKETEDDLLVEVELAFTSPSSLATFLDPKGVRASYSEIGGEKILNMVLAGGQAKLDPELKKLVEAAFAPYQVSLVFNFPSSVRSAGIGKASNDGLVLSYSERVTTLATSQDPVIWEIRW